MGLKYYKLFDLLNRKGMKKSDLRQILSPTTVAKLSKGEYISGEAISKICKFLNCQPGDIMEYIEEEKPTRKEAYNEFKEDLADFKKGNIKIGEMAKKSWKHGTDIGNADE